MRAITTALYLCLAGTSGAWAQGMIWERLFQDEGASDFVDKPNGLVLGVDADVLVPPVGDVPLESNPLVAINMATQGHVNVTLARVSAPSLMGALKDFGFVVVGVHPAPAFWPEGVRKDLRVTIRYDGVQPLALVLPAGVGSNDWSFVLEGPPTPFLIVHVGALAPTDRPVQADIAQLAVDVPYPKRCAALGPDTTQEEWLVACFDPLSDDRAANLSVVAGYGFGWLLEPDGRPVMVVGPGVHRLGTPGSSEESSPVDENTP